MGVFRMRRLLVSISSSKTHLHFVLFYPPTPPHSSPPQAPLPHLPPRSTYTPHHHWSYYQFLSRKRACRKTTSPPLCGRFENVALAISARLIEKDGGVYMICGLGGVVCWGPSRFVRAEVGRLKFGKPGLRGKGLKRKRVDAAGGDLWA